MHMANEGWPGWSDPTDELLELKLLKKFMLVLIERCQNTQCIAVWCILRISGLLFWQQKGDQHNMTIRWS